MSHRIRETIDAAHAQLQASLSVIIGQPSEAAMIRAVEVHLADLIPDPILRISSVTIDAKGVVTIGIVLAGVVVSCHVEWRP